MLVKVKRKSLLMLSRSIAYISAPSASHTDYRGTTKTHPSHELLKKKSAKEAEKECKDISQIIKE